jgi:hypothetical protein
LFIYRPEAQLLLHILSGFKVRTSAFARTVHLYVVHVSQYKQA